MSLCAVDYRYGRPAMKALFSEDAKLRRMLEVEAALAQAQAAVGDIPAEAAAEIGRNADMGTVTVERVNALEAETRHDVMAVVMALAEKCEGDAGGYVHLGATSNDIIDTATALQLKAAVRILREDLDTLVTTLGRVAKAHRDTVMLGRTHGQAATPITFGLKAAVFALEVHRHRERLVEMEGRIVVGKVSGAVGTGAALGPKAQEIQERVTDALGIGYEPASGQIVGRDRHAEFIALLANIAASCEKFCTEVRNLQRTEIGEVAESFGRDKQVGSSTMANKQNPVTSENVCGLARIVRAFVGPALENVVTWHERDLANSSAERIMVPHALVLVDDILAKTELVFANLRVFPKRMRENIERTNGQVMSEAVMIALVRKGLGRQEAHKTVREIAMEAREQGIHLRDALAKDAAVKAKFTVAELDDVMDPAKYTGSAGEIVDHTLEIVG
jgi:adenylosuccinate lyase